MYTYSLRKTNAHILLNGSGDEKTSYRFPLFLSPLQMAWTAWISSMVALTSAERLPAKAGCRVSAARGLNWPKTKKIVHVCIKPGRHAAQPTAHTHTHTRTQPRKSFHVALSAAISLWLISFFKLDLCGETNSPTASNYSLTWLCCRLTSQSRRQQSVNAKFTRVNFKVKRPWWDKCSPGLVV